MRWFDLRSRSWLLVLLILPAWMISSRLYRFSRGLMLAQGALGQGLTQQAAVHLEEAAQELPWRSDLWEQAGSTALQGGDLKAAIRLLEQVEAGRGLSPGGRLSLGDAHDQAGDLETAVRTWQAALGATRDPQPELLMRLLEAHRELGDAPSMISDLESLTAIRPADAGLRYQLGLLLAAYRPEASLAHLAQAAELDAGLKKPAGELMSSIRTAQLAGDPSYTLLAAGRALASVSEWELAVAAFHQAVQVRPDYAEAWAFLGEARQHLQKKVSTFQPTQESGSESGSKSGADGYADLERALQLDPRSLSANLFLALYWQRQGSYDRALEALQTAERLHPDSPAVQIEKGHTLAALGDLSAAFEAFQRAVDLAPKDPQYLRSLAFFSLSHEYLIREVGLPAARQAVLLAPQEPASLDLMGQVLLQLGDPLTAERFLKRALNAQSNYAPAHLHLGWVYLLTGDQNRAYSQFQRARDLDPDSPTAEQAERLLQNYFP